MGVSTEDAQSYRDRGLLQPARRRRGRSGDKAYHQEHVERLQFIARALSYGFSLEAIAQLVAPSALLTCRDVHAIGMRELEGLRQRVGPGGEVVGALASLLARCRQIGGRKDCAVLAVLAQKATRPLKPREKV
jgi:DNA-binding transcriptional MerR regulator